jgi:hypothetical protein
MRKVLAATAGAVVLLMALGSCGGGGGDPVYDNGSSRGNTDAYSSLNKKAGTARYKVTYRTTNPDGNRTEEFTIARDGAGKVAYTGNDSALIINGDRATRCTNLGRAPVCSDVQGGAASAQALVGSYTGALNAADAIISAAVSTQSLSDQSSETIAGREATCWRVSAADVGGVGGEIFKRLSGDASGKVCLDRATGAKLKLELTGVGRTQSAEAIAFDKPSAQDFAPPANARTGPSETAPEATTPTTAPCPTGTLPTGITLPCFGIG